MRIDGEIGAVLCDKCGTVGPVGAQTLMEARRWAEELGWVGYSEGLEPFRTTLLLCPVCQSEFGTDDTEWDF